MLDRLTARAQARAEDKRQAAITRLCATAPRWLRAEASRAGVVIKAKRLRWWLITHAGQWGFWR